MTHGRMSWAAGHPRSGAVTAERAPPSSPSASSSASAVPTAPRLGAVTCLLPFSLYSLPGTLCRACKRFDVMNHKIAPFIQNLRMNSDSTRMDWTHTRSYGLLRTAARSSITLSLFKSHRTFVFRNNSYPPPGIIGAAPGNMTHPASNGVYMVGSWVTAWAHHHPPMETARKDRLYIRNGIRERSGLVCGPARGSEPPAPGPESP